MREKNNKNNKINKSKSNIILFRRILLITIIIIISIYLLAILVQFLINPTNIYVVENDQIFKKDTTIGYIIREETVVEGENYKNGMVKIKAEGEKVAKGENIFRYYTAGEQTLVAQIEALDVKIDEAINNETDLFSSDTKVLDNLITEKINEVYSESDLQIISENKNSISESIIKKAKIAGELSPSGSYLKELIEQRSVLENKLNSQSEYLSAPITGMMSYRVDGLENILTTTFNNLTVDLLDDINMKTGQIIATSEEKGKIVNNYECYIATILSSDEAKKAFVDDKVQISLSNGNIIEAKISYMKQDGDDYIVVFKIMKNVEELIDYRKIAIDVIWWSANGIKLVNKSIKYEEKDGIQIPYVIRTRSGYSSKVYVKILKDNGDFSIVENYSTQELEELGFTLEEISQTGKIALYDEVIIK